MFGANGLWLSASGPAAGGGCGAKSPPLAARPEKTSIMETSSDQRIRGIILKKCCQTNSVHGQFHNNHFFPKKLGSALSKKYYTCSVPYYTCSVPRTPFCPCFWGLICQKMIVVNSHYLWKHRALAQPEIGRKICEIPEGNCLDSG